MLVSTNLDQKLKFRKVDDLVDMPVVVRVNKFDEAAATAFANDFQKAHNTGQEVIPVVIDSYGGHVYSLLAMIDVVKSSRVPVATVVSGKAMSCGALLLSFGAEGMRFAAPHARVMIHEVSLGAWGKVEEVKADAKEGDFLNNHLYELMAKNCGKPKNYFIELMHEKKHADWYLSAAEALKHNLVNEVRVPQFTVDVKVNVQFG